VRIASRSPVGERAGAGGIAQAPTGLFIAGKSGDGRGHGQSVARRHDHPAALDRRGDGCADTSAGNHRPTAGQHEGKLGGHDQIGRIGALRQQMDVAALSRSFKRATG